MIPQTDNYTDVIVDDDFEYIDKSSLTYEIDPKTYRVKSTKVDGLEAVKQAVYLVLSTERYEYIIYDEYGVELWELYGREDSYVIPELERVMTEAVLRDDRVEAVSNFKIKRDGKARIVTFTVHSVFGDFEAEKEVLV